MKKEKCGEGVSIKSGENPRYHRTNKQFTPSEGRQYKFEEVSATLNVKAAMQIYRNMKNQGNTLSPKDNNNLPIT